MSETSYSGGYAFGVPAVVPGHDMGEPGMTVREYVATHVLAAIIANEGAGYPISEARDASIRALTLADALIKELNK